MLLNISCKSVHPLYQEKSLPQLLTKKLEKMEDFRNGHFSQIPWNALNFFHMFEPNFNSPLKSIEHKV